MKKIQHYLISAPVGRLPIGHGLFCHAYLMCTDKKETERATNRLIDEIEKRGWEIWPGIILSTDLTRGGHDVVRDILYKRMPETRHNLENAKQFHFTVWMMPEADPDNQQLMELH